jgi:ribose-phosphate pyrophosphokinase
MPAQSLSPDGDAGCHHQARTMQRATYPSHGPVKIFTGNAHPSLAKAIAEELNLPVAKATVSRFKCGEVHVQINESVRDCDVFIVQPTCNGGGGPNEHLMELLIMIDAARRAAANRITAVMPVYGYARSSAKEQSRTPIAAKLVADLLEVAGADRVLTVELHMRQIQGFAQYPIDNMYALPILSRELQKVVEARGLNNDDLVVVSPDVGGAKRASALAKRLCAPLAIFSRQRRRATEKGELDIVGEVAGKTCIIVDDIADTADTLCNAADKLKEKGAEAVIGTIVHGVLSDPACELIMKSKLELVLLSDTIPLDDKMARCPKLKVISVAPLLAAAIMRIHTGESLSMLFDATPPERVLANDLTKMDWTEIPSLQE